MLTNLTLGYEPKYNEYTSRDDNFVILDRHDASDHIQATHAGRPSSLTMMMVTLLRRENGCFLEYKDSTTDTTHCSPFCSSTHDDAMYYVCGTTPVIPTPKIVLVKTSPLHSSSYLSAPNELPMIFCGGDRTKFH